MKPNKNEIRLYAAPFSEGRIGSHDLLFAAARDYAGEEIDTTLARGAYGKPYFPHAPHLHFSISHSGDWWMCAFSAKPVGLDLQVVQPCAREKLSRRFFHPDEDAFLRQTGYADFFRVWSAKESYLKYTGQGITQELRAFSTVAPNGAFPSVETAWMHMLPWQEEYALCLCAEKAHSIAFYPLSL